MAPRALEGPIAHLIELRWGSVVALDKGPAAGEQVLCGLPLTIDLAVAHCPDLGRFEPFALELFQAQRGHLLAFGPLASKASLFLFFLAKVVEDSQSFFLDLFLFSTLTCFLFSSMQHKREESVSNVLIFFLSHFSSIPCGSTSIGAITPESL